MEIRSRKDLVDYVNNGNSVKYLYFWGHQKPKEGVSKTCFSQWYEANFEIDGVIYQTAEHYETGAGGYLISGGKNGGGIVDAILASVAALLGYVDGSLDYLSKIDKVWFSQNLQYLKSLARASVIAGVLGLVASFVNVVNGGATGWNAVGQVSTAIFAFAATIILVSAVAAALAAAPLLAALAAAAIAASIALLTARFASLYF